MSGPRPLRKHHGCSGDSNLEPPTPEPLHHSGPCLTRYSEVSGSSCPDQLMRNHSYNGSIQPKTHTPLLWLRWYFGSVCWLLPLLLPSFFLFSIANRSTLQSFFLIVGLLMGLYTIASAEKTRHACRIGFTLFASHMPGTGHISYILIMQLSYTMEISP